ncbi:MAG: HupE/UreJ family protein [Chthoniobacter sp.]|uniref:HupE/UreJ family protein n=1 Tax=Chthoniobacter sp. TaxID=2510640 RepID=UPI0032A512DD
MRPVFLFLLAFLGSVGFASAHPLLQNAMWMQFEPTRVHVAVNVSVREIAVAQNLVAKDDSFDGAALSAAAEKHRDYVGQHLKVSADGRALTGQVLRITDPPIFSEPEKTYYQYELEFTFAGPTPGKITVTQDMLREWPYALGTPWDVNYIVRLKRSDANEITTALLRPQQPTDFSTGWSAPSTQASEAPKAEGWRTFREYFWHGVMHILTGWDHLLFVAALVIATMNFWEMVKVIAAFTVAHTITLALSVFAIVRLPPWVVEPVIAISIIFVAVENVVRPQNAHSRLRLAVAFGFGLIHGLGFAGGLLDAMVGLPRIGTWIALGAFSLGVEVGHQVVVLPLFGALAAGRQQLQERFTRPALRYGSMFISLCGVYYLGVALHEQFFAR